MPKDLGTKLTRAKVRDEGDNQLYLTVSGDKRNCSKLAFAPAGGLNITSLPEDGPLVITFYPMHAVLWIEREAD